MPTPAASPAPFARAAAMVTLGLLGGCAGRQGLVHKGTAADKPPELQTLADLQPPVAMPAPATRPDAPAPDDALEAYARGRDAILRNQKATAIKELTAAVDIDADSAVVWRDLGYAEIGMDDAKAAAAFRRARTLDPNDADSRLQLARLLLNNKQTDAAVAELRMARLGDEYAASDGLAAVVDLLLGQSLENAHFRTAALECYENVLAILDDHDVDLRGRPELADVLQRPGILVLRTADLATQCGKYSRAIELYQRLQKQEPQSALTLELRLARAQLAAGDRAGATRRAFDYVSRSGLSHLSLALFDELYEPYGGPATALAEVQKLGNAVDADRTNLLRSHLLLAKGDAAGAVDAVKRVGRSQAGPTTTPSDDPDIGLATARQTVHAYRAAGRDHELLYELLDRTAQSPAAWHVWERAWGMLTQPAQSHPLTPDDLLGLYLKQPPAPVINSARAFVISQAYASAGRVRAAKKYAVISATGPAPFDATAAAKSPPVQAITDDLDTPKELAVVIDDYRDDPELLTAAVAAVLRDGGKRMVIDAFAAVQAVRPDDPVIAAAYAQVLAADDRRAEATAVLDKAVAKAASAGALYSLASQYGALGDDKSAERVLRKAYAADAASPAVCNDLGYLLTDQGRELPFAEQLLTRAATAEPDNAAYLDSLGWLLYKRAKFGDAARRLEEAVDAATPVDPVVLDHAGDALYQAHQPQQAAGRWQQAVDAIKQRGTADPQLRLRIEQKLRQMDEKSPVLVAPVAKAE